MLGVWLYSPELFLSIFHVLNCSFRDPRVRTIYISYCPIFLPLWLKSSKGAFNTFKPLANQLANCFVMQCVAGDDQLPGTSVVLPCVAGGGQEQYANSLVMLPGASVVNNNYTNDTEKISMATLSESQRHLEPMGMANLGTGIEGREGLDATSVNEEAQGAGARHAMLHSRVNMVAELVDPRPCAEDHEPTLRDVMQRLDVIEKLVRCNQPLDRSAVSTTRALGKLEEKAVDVEDDDFGHTFEKDIDLAVSRKTLMRFKVTGWLMEKGYGFTKSSNGETVFCLRVCRADARLPPEGFNLRRESHS